MNLNRELLRAAGEHLGALAEEAKTRMELGTTSTRRCDPKKWDRYAFLYRLSKDVLSLAAAERAEGPKT